MHTFFAKGTADNITVPVNLKDRDAFHISIEEYLLSLISLIEELSRLAINSVTLGDYQRPLQISQFVKDLHAGFQILNLKNDVLRRRSDGIKYNVKKIEDIVYDLSLRNLVARPESTSWGQGRGLDCCSRASSILWDVGNVPLLKAITDLDFNFGSRKMYGYLLGRFRDIMRGGSWKMTATTNIMGEGKKLFYYQTTFAIKLLTYMTRTNHEYPPVNPSKTASWYSHSRSQYQKFLGTCRKMPTLVRSSKINQRTRKLHSPDLANDNISNAIDRSHHHVRNQSSIWRNLLQI